VAQVQVDLIGDAVHQHPGQQIPGPGWIDMK
jgi:hypothetical protein